jgi:hypothetical protein
MWIYVVVGAGFVVATNLPVVVVARAIARNMERRADRGRAGLDPELRVRLEGYARAPERHPSRAKRILGLQRVVLPLRQG